MKQEIVCEECLSKLQALFPSATPHPGEHVKFIKGKAKNNFICDQCGKPIEADSNCTAFSSWADYGGIPYYNWEPEYIYGYEIKMTKREKKKYQVRNEECYDRDCFVPFEGKGIKICRLYEIGQCPAVYCGGCGYTHIPGTKCPTT